MVDDNSTPTLTAIGNYSKEKIHCDKMNKAQHLIECSQRIIRQAYPDDQGMGKLSIQSQSLLLYKLAFPCQFWEIHNSLFANYTLMSKFTKTHLNNKINFPRLREIRFLSIIIRFTMYVQPKQYVILCISNLL